MPIISIHALRVEGDRGCRRSKTDKSSYFYPRPPGGGRRALADIIMDEMQFLSTPSGWRATMTRRPSKSQSDISIHALRVEGDSVTRAEWADAAQFLSTPSGWRATCGGDHAEMEGIIFLSTPSGWRATRSREQSGQTPDNFYPRPPGGGRPSLKRLYCFGVLFLSTPSGWRATVQFDFTAARVNISIHALRVEGDYHHGSII